MTAAMQVSAVILYHRGLMLVNRRPEGAYYSGWWEWPGGKREPGESAEACARRELLEEIGITAGPLREYRRLEVEYPERRIELTFFLGRAPSNRQPSPGALEHRWLPPGEVLALKFLEPNLPILKALIAGPPVEAAPE